MNRLNKIILSFVLPFFCLLISVSYADLVANESYSSNSWSVSSQRITELNGYTQPQCGTILRNYLSDPTNETYKTDFEAFKNAFLTGYDSYFVNINTGSSGSYYNIYFFNKADFQMCFASEDSVKVKIYSNQGDYINIQTHQDASFNHLSFMYRYTVSSAGLGNYVYDFNSIPYFETNANIYNIVITGNTFYWDGTYYYEASSSEEPPIVEDLQLKKIIDELFTSNTFLSFPDSWRNNFFIIYNKSSNTYEIIVAPDYVYFRGYKYIKNESDYYRMLAGSSPNFDTYDFSNLVNNSYTEYTNPLGSFNFYKFIYECDEEGNIINRYNRTFNNMTSDKTEYLTENQILVYTRRNIPFYTLNTDGSFSEDTTSSLPSTELKDENGEIIVITPPKQPQDEIINDADFGDLSNSFEEHKGIFSFTENMQWLISANNKLSNYFLGFIVMCALFITLGRVLKG